MLAAAQPSTVLVVHDERSVRVYMARVLEASYSVLEAQTGSRRFRRDLSALARDLLAV
jgi:response regulator RpfG family c-di-GMP phosphodiesterase